MRNLCFVLAVATLLGAATSQAAVDARMMRAPDVSATHIAFSYAGDIWLVPKAGGTAQRLSTPPGEEVFPRFSPDGRSLAYSANYDGNVDVYVVSAEGGVPTRITHHPAVDRMLDWYPDGSRLLFATSMTSGKDRFNQLYRVGKDGGLPEKLPMPYGEFGMISPDGTTLAYMPATRDFRTWKRYRGGWTPDIWLFDLTTQASRNITANAANDSQPMWYGSTLYFLSDRDAVTRYNLWAMDLASGATRQITRFETSDCRFPAIGPSDIVFENAGRLYLLELPGETLREVKVEVLTDRATLKPRDVNATKLLAGADVSPAGKRVYLEARGEVFSVPAEKGVVLNLTRASGSAERFPAASPDGKQVAYFSDASGEYELWVRPADGTGVARQVTTLGPGFRYRPFWSPDSKKVAFVDQAMKIWICDAATGTMTQVDKALYWYQGNLMGFAPSWSADSRWLAYSRDLHGRASNALFLFDTATNERHQVTSGFYDTVNPAFDPDGKYLYVLTNRTFKPSYSDLDNSWIYANTTNLAAIPLRKDVPSPLAARNDVEGEDTKDGEKKDKAKDKGKNDDTKTGKDAAKDEKKKDEPKPVAIDLDGLESRLVVLSEVAAGNLGSVQPIPGKVLYRRLPNTGSADEKTPVMWYDIEEREEKTLLADVDGYRVAAGGTKMLAWKKGTYAVVDVKPDQKLDKAAPTGDLPMTVDPVAEWRQIFNDVWRLERDYFYDPNMHGVDWAAMRERYGRLLDDAVTRADVNFVVGELIAELNASHTYRGGGDQEQAPERGVGLLGADFTLENGAYRIARILRGAPWESEARSPLAQPGVNVKEGDYLLAVNRVPLDVTKSPWAAFQGLAGKTVTLTINGSPTMQGARDVLVEALESEYRLRNLAWIEEKRAMTERLSGGRVGYVYVPDTGVNGQTELVRQFMGQFTKDGMIIDERFNSGGQIPDRFVELLNRPLYNYWGVRDGTDWQWPPVSHLGPKAMLINGWSGSGGDCFPFYFKEAGLGPLVGTRTWGGLIGMTGVPALIDGGNVTVPTFGIYSRQGEWIIESHGVEPDIEVVDDPTAMARGGDPQLERAIKEVLNALEATPPKQPVKPAYPNRAGR